MWSSFTGANNFYTWKSHKQLPHRSEECTDVLRRKQQLQSLHRLSLWGSIGRNPTYPCPTPLWIFCSLSQGALSACWGTLRIEMNASLSLFVLKHGSSHPLPLPFGCWPPRRAEAHPRDSTTNRVRGENKKPCGPVKCWPGKGSVFQGCTGKGIKKAPGKQNKSKDNKASVVFSCMS